MINRNVFFNFASSEGGKPGIRPVTSKLSRFNLVVPWFKAGKMYFPEELRDTTIMGLFMGQIKLATINGIKGKDDCIDTISMLGYLNPWKPQAGMTLVDNKGDPMWDEEEEDSVNPLRSYIV